MYIKDTDHWRLVNLLGFVKKLSEGKEELRDAFEEINVILNKKVLRVRDGFVTPDDMVWWRSKNGPVLVQASRDWCNIRDYPQFYQIEEPKVYNKIAYEDEDEG